jgi:hypothetical protein
MAPQKEGHGILNAENLFLIQNRHVAVSDMLEAVVMFDHYKFRDGKAKSPTKRFFLQKRRLRRGIQLGGGRIILIRRKRGTKCISPRS